MFTVSNLLELPALKRGLPEVVSGHEHLQREVRWAHVLDVADATGLLKGGEFVLSNGFGLGHETRTQRNFIRDLFEQDAAALAVELGILFRGELPAAMTDEAESLGMPLIALHRKTRFVEVTEAVHQLVMSREFTLLREADELSQRLTALVLGGAEVPELLTELARALGNPVVLEDASGRVVAWAAHQAGEDFVLRAWNDLLAAERRQGEQVRGAIDARIRLVNGPRGRLIAFELDGPLDELAATLVRRGAEAISLRLVTRHQEDQLAAHSRGTWLAEVAAGHVGDQDASRRAAALGFEWASPCVVTAAAAWRPTAYSPGSESWLAIVPDLRTALARAGMNALIGPHGDVLLILVDPGRAGEPDALAEDVAQAIMRGAGRHQLDQHHLALTIGPSASNWTEAGRALARAAQHGRVAAREPTRLWHDARRVSLNDALYEMAESPTLRMYVHDRIGPLVEGEPDRRRAELLHTLEVYLRHAGRKTAAAQELHLERQSLYHRLERLQQLLDVDWQDGEQLLELHLAVRARRLLDLG
jgi:PucR family transcriptional regulator, purine catabolism regulatory protein